MKNRIHILGASGSGTTTIAKAVSEQLGYTHFDTDSYYWLPTEEPFTETRSIDERLRLLNADLSHAEKWVLSGSLDGWGDPLIPFFDLVVFVYVPNEVRIARLRQRGIDRFGDEVLPGGPKYEANEEFIEWAAGYESGLLTGRSLPRHEKWLSELDCPVIKVINESLEDSVEQVISAIKEVRS